MGRDGAASRAIAATIAALVAIAGVPAAWADGGGKGKPGAGAASPDDAEARRKVAVLEYRAGSTALPGLDRRIAGLLKQQTSLTVIDADEARKDYGARLDAAVVDCGGEPACIAKIGAKVGAREVVLVGVSEFGDVILTLQRIDVRRGKVAVRIAEALAEDASPDDAALVGYLRRVMPENDFLRFGTIKVTANLAGAQVFLGKDPKGKTPIAPLRVHAPATYQIRLTKDGYVPFTARVQVPPDGDIEVDARLTREGGGAWYTRWWVAAIAGVVIAGGVGAGYLLTREPPTAVPGTGTID
ncbi:MAG: PEGA domain-containing protein [Kofleriaceae bacterium]|nr:PEGA domain-containing protein [Myxococcales bacterium]MCB9563516.1 PEGA domain-containing protein [Kofleriaceae bacterium]